MNADGGGYLLRAVQLYAWAVFLAAWAQMGWVDWKEQKIRNNFLFFWLKFVAVGYLIIFAQSALGAAGYLKVYIVRDYYSALLLHAVVSMTAAYALWWLRIWPAGDVKLFVLLSLCYPLMRIPGSFRSNLLFLEVLINVFVPAAAFLFLTAGEYLWRTRFDPYRAQLTAFARSYYRDFRLPELSLASFAPSPNFDPRASFAAASSAVRARGAWFWQALKKELGDGLAAYRAEPWRLAVDAVTWIAMMAIMSMISYALNDIITSNVLKTLVCFALMFTWSRFCQFIGTGRALALAFVVCGILLWRHPNVNFPALAVIFGHITVFSLFIFIGVQLAFKIIGGHTGYMLFPFIMLFIGLIPFRRIFGGIWTGLAAVVGAIGSLAPTALPRIALPAFPALPAPAWLASADLPGLAVWAVMGLFFGLALVFVKIWDAESYKTVPIAHIEKFMTLGPSLVARIEDDEDFRDEHFTAFYADGLTGEQAEALREWCANEGIDTVPLAPTISFANWIFLGYFLTRLLEGHVLRFLY